jgi:hypothetical protein
MVKASLNYTKYNKCKNNRCGAKVTVGTSYCCSPCMHAHEEGYEIHDHSEGCKQRQNERK